MPRFLVTRKPFYDGLHLHKPGTVVEIEPEDYPTLLSRDFEGQDPQAKAAIAKARAEVKNARGQPYQPPLTESGTLDPSKKSDLEKLAPKGVRVVETPAEPVAVRVATPK